MFVWTAPPPAWNQTVQGTLNIQTAVVEVLNGSVNYHLRWNYTLLDGQSISVVFFDKWSAKIAYSELSSSSAYNVQYFFTGRQNLLLANVPTGFRYLLLSPYLPTTVIGFLGRQISESSLVLVPGCCFQCKQNEEYTKPLWPASCGFSYLFKLCLLIVLKDR